MLMRRARRSLHEQVEPRRALCFRHIWVGSKDSGTPSEMRPGTVAVADFNGEWQIDLVVANDNRRMPR